MPSRAFLPAAVLLAALLVPSPSVAQPSSGWTGKAGVNLVSSSGNSSAGSLGIRLETRRFLRGLLLAVDSGALRSSTDTVRRQAFGTPDDFDVLRSVDRDVQADRTWVKTRLSNGEGADAPRPSWYLAAGWDRDAPAGVAARYELAAGMGSAFGAGSAGREPPLYLGAGFTLVGQQDEVRDAEVAANTVGLRLDARSSGRLRNVDLSVVARGVWNLRNRDDLRLDATGSAAVPVSEFLAFQPSLQALWDSRPSLVLVPLAPAPGAPVAGSVPVRRGRLDLILLASLTVRWGES